MRSPTQSVSVQTEKVGGSSPEVRSPEFGQKRQNQQRRFGSVREPGESCLDSLLEVPFIHLAITEMQGNNKQKLTGCGPEAVAFFRIEALNYLFTLCCSSTPAPGPSLSGYSESLTLTKKCFGVQVCCLFWVWVCVRRNVDF